MRIYLDVCCLNRPFDDQSQDRVFLESEAVLSILQRIEAGTWSSVRSIVHDEEIARIRDLSRRLRIELLASKFDQLPSDEEIEGRSRELTRLGFGGADARHLGYAEGYCDLFLTTDDKLEYLASRVSNRLAISVQNPVSFIVEVIER